MNKERLLILDSNSLLNRAFYALPDLMTGEGIHTNAIYGFVNMLLKMKEEIKPDYIIAAFDRKAPTFRHEEYKDYKAGRKKMPEELAQQFPIVKELLSALAINIFEIDGFEADDLIGTLSVFAEEKGIEVYIVTGDKDALQLATDNVKVVITKKGITEKEIYDKNRMIEEFGVTPKEFIDVKGLMGDTSDNIPGVPGIGEKTAFKLIKEYKSIETVLENIENIKGKKLKENLHEYREQAIFSKKLATIICNVPIDMSLEDIKSKEEYDINKVREMFEKLEFKSLMNKVGKSDEEETVEEEVSYKNIVSLEEFKDLKNNIIKYKENDLYLYFELEDIVLFSKSRVKTLYANFKDEVYRIDFEMLLNNTKEQFIEVCKEMFESKEIKKITYDAKNPRTILRKLGIEFNGIKFDINLAAYLIDPVRKEYEISSLASEYLFKNINREDEFLKIKEVNIMPNLYKVLEEKIKEQDMEELLYKVEQPLTETLSAMETEGFKVDKDILLQLEKRFKGEIESTQLEIYSMSEEEFNINSPKQLGKILFEKLDLPVIKKTKTGYSTNAEVLDKLRDKHPIIDKITYYRQLTKIYSTYIEGLKAAIDEDGKIHSNFNQTVTATGRLSSTEPNLQNIPIKYEMGREIRKVFIPNTGDSVILSADYSQIELRVLAHISDDKNMISAFNEHDDIHTKTASEVFKVPIEEVTPLMRSNAKAVNFGIVYGIGDFSLSQDLNITRKEAKQYIDAYLERYPNVKLYLENIVEEAVEKGYVSTILNRRRYIKEVKSSNKIVKAAGERLAMNSPIQGSAADIIKLAMVNVHRKLKEDNFKSSIILQVHDELILNVHKDELEKIKALVKKEMEQVLELKVGLDVDINIGNNWYEAK
ncbi:DNA polymerase I [Clostridium botulinum]|uniref:DNA polymerase I n=1 Tax=Clostridium botulinum TaxID=1491 RepID=A0A6G4CML0_CLOBO|nr:DNA polymerase I [Clostridium botulinum]NFA00058.1 DNA polymerase I [Clostridium botulinum]NFA30221.1 DNA polymerase I [Clostridium botulinum]NFA87108.1 DNA polymerase I [Clostridium botulinum]NFB04737.1 DNA polymerase I [Clostridium botulinum]